jgi:xanthine dehydrogenase accessory factor
MLKANDISRALDQARDDGRALALVSLIERSGKPPLEITRMLVGEDGTVAGGTLGDHNLDEVAVGHALGFLADERQEIVTVSLDDDVRLLLEVSRPPLELIICGGGHVGRAVAAAGRLLDFRVTVIDDRPDFASRERFHDPSIRLIAGDFTTSLHELKITPATHIVIVTRGHRHDELCLREVIDRPARYIGMIGSRRRTTTIREHLRREGVTAELLRQVRAPIGLDIGAQTPEEIALAILAEITLTRRGGSGRPKSAEGPMARAR